MVAAIDDSEVAAGRRRWLTRTLAIALGVALLVAGYLGVRQLLERPAAPQRQVARISLVPDTPPPPPPPPPKEEKKPEPVKETPKAATPIEQPKQPPPQQTPPQQAEQLKMEGQGSDSGMAGVAAGSVAQEYQGQTIGGTGGGGGGFDPFGAFRSELQIHVQRALQQDDVLRQLAYRVRVNVWLGADGRLRAELLDSSGTPDTDARLRKVLAELPPLSGPIPDGLPQPARLRLTSRT